MPNTPDDADLPTSSEDASISGAEWDPSNEVKFDNLQFIDHGIAPTESLASDGPETPDDGAWDGEPTLIAHKDITYQTPGHTVTIHPAHLMRAKELWARECEGMLSVSELAELDALLTHVFHW